jgi:hypothetical protein
MTDYDYSSWQEVRYCEHCGDELTASGHATVSHCVALCGRCGGLRPADDRWGPRPGDRCDCPEAEG